MMVLIKHIPISTLLKEALVISIQELFLLKMLMVRLYELGYKLLVVQKYFYYHYADKPTIPVQNEAYEQWLIYTKKPAINLLTQTPQNVTANKKVQTVDFRIPIPVFLMLLMVGFQSLM